MKIKEEAEAAKYWLDEFEETLLTLSVIEEEFYHIKLEGFDFYAEDNLDELFSMVYYAREELKELMGADQE